MMNTKRKLKIVEWQPGYDKIQNMIFKAVVNYKRHTYWKVGRIPGIVSDSSDPNIPFIVIDAPDFDPKTQLYLEVEGDYGFSYTSKMQMPDFPKDLSHYFVVKKALNRVKIVGFMTADNFGQVSYPWIICGNRNDNDQNRDLLYEEMEKRLKDKGIEKMTTCYDDNWCDVLYYFLKKGFKEIDRFVVVTGRIKDFENEETDVTDTIKLRKFEEKDIDEIINLPSLKGKYSAELVMQFINNNLLKENVVIESRGKIIGNFTSYMMNNIGGIAGVSTIPPRFLKNILGRCCTFFAANGATKFSFRISKDAVDLIKTMKILPLMVGEEYVRLEKRII